jgi:hypothetical protein
MVQFASRLSATNLAAGMTVETEKPATEPCRGLSFLSPVENGITLRRHRAGAT